MLEFFRQMILSIIQDEITEIKIDELSMIPKEDFIVSVTKSGYIKKMSIKAVACSSVKSYSLTKFSIASDLFLLARIVFIISSK